MTADAYSRHSITTASPTERVALLEWRVAFIKAWEPLLSCGTLSKTRRGQKWQADRQLETKTY